jgi:hypothetical protein
MTNYTRRAYVEITAHGIVYLYNTDGVWIGPGLGDFRDTAAAKAWGRANGYIVAHAVRRA